MHEWCHKLDVTDYNGDSWWQVRIPGVDKPETWLIPNGVAFYCPTCGARLRVVDDVPSTEEMVPRAALERVSEWMSQGRRCPPPWSPEWCPHVAAHTEPLADCVKCIAQAALGAVEEENDDE